MLGNVRQFWIRFYFPRRARAIILVVASRVFEKFFSIPAHAHVLGLVRGDICGICRMRAALLHYISRGARACLIITLFTESWLMEHNNNTLNTYGVSTFPIDNSIVICRGNLHFRCTQLRFTGAILISTIALRIIALHETSIMQIICRYMEAVFTTDREDARNALSNVSRPLKGEDYSGRR